MELVKVNMLGVIIKTAKSNKLKNLRTMFVGDNCIIESLENLSNFDIDFFVQNGIKKPLRENNDIYEYVEKTGKPILIREMPVLRDIAGKTQTKIPFEQQWFRFSWNSFFMDDGIHPYDPSYDRWSEISKKYNIEVKNWQRRGDAILLNLQKDGDSALNRLTYSNIDYKQYIVDVIEKIKQINNRPLIIRGHPLDQIVVPYLQNFFPDIEYSKNRSLYDDLDRSWCMITYNSTSCVEASLYGTPTITLDSSAVSWEVSQHYLNEIEKEHKIDRKEWCKKISFMQWQGSELTDGYVWNLLKKSIGA